ncbi:hypothetical protein [Herbaspirillum sp. YR522]|uniref:hypothetical protein n=1 Tax=Herbaspirillum sp. YR522 TaxID=1144342 RepID=UPI0012FB77F6|nr:hypothetical protein [Herbaspirillum sp. YR522]
MTFLLLANVRNGGITDRINGFLAQNGSALKDYFFEENILGGMFATKALGLLGRLLGNETDLLFAGTVNSSGKGTNSAAGAVDDAVATSTTGKIINVDSKGNALAGDWSATKTLSAPENALAHWTKHASEFPEFKNASQYVEEAQNFVSNPPTGVLTKTKPNGDVMFYDPATNTFAVKTLTNAPRTMFRPTDGINYWNKQ